MLVPDLLVTINRRIPPSRFSRKLDDFFAVRQEALVPKIHNQHVLCKIAGHAGVLLLIDREHEGVKFQPERLAQFSVLSLVVRSTAVLRWNSAAFLDKTL